MTKYFIIALDWEEIIYTYFESLILFAKCCDINDYIDVQNPLSVHVHPANMFLY